MAFYTNPWIYGIALLVVMFAWASIRSMVKGIPFINKKNNLLIALGIGLLLTSGIIGSLSLGSFAGTAVAGGWSISDVQITGLTPSYVGGTLAVDASNPYLINGRYTDAQANETAGVLEMNTSTFTITRSGALNADSCIVTISSSDFTINEVTGAQSSTPYNILEKDATGRFKAYLKDGTGASTTDSQGQVAVAFAEGVAQETFSMVANVDEESHDALNAYSSKDVVIDVCGKQVIYKVARMD